MFLDFRSDNLKDELYELDSQILLGSSFLASPVVTSNERKKKTYFPSDLFYDFYTGKPINEEGEKFISVNAPLDHLPLFIRGGFIVPLQNNNEKVKNMSEMRKKPIDLLIALDNTFRSVGYIIIDDGFCKYL